MLRNRSVVAIGRRCRYAGGVLPYGVRPSAVLPFGVLPAAVVIGDEENFAAAFTGRSPEVR